MAMEIPQYPESRLLEISDKKLFDSVFIEKQPEISEFSFANLFLFRHAHSYKLTRLNDSIVVLGHAYEGTHFFLPPMTGNISQSLQELQTEGLTLYGADSALINKYLDKRSIDIIPDRDNFDYLYLREDLAGLPGNRFHKKKNRIKYFTSRHLFRVELYREEFLEECISLLDEWGRIHSGTENNSISLEIAAAGEALQMAAILGLQGLVVLVEGVVKAFSLGEKLNKDMSVCHFEKADPFMEGLFQFINREFSSQLFIDCRYVNREQDLGEPNIRKTKLSYHPIRMVEKFRVRLRSYNRKV